MEQAQLEATAQACRAEELAAELALARQARDDPTAALDTALPMLPRSATASRPGGPVVSRPDLE